MPLTQVSPALLDTQAQYTGFKNRIINGDMRIDQRNAGASVTINTAATTYTLDRWSAYGQATDGVFTVQRSSTAPAGFTNSLLVTVTTADSSIGASQIYIAARQKIEGFNVVDLGWGTANAQTVTISFWVRSSVTGTFSGSVLNSVQNRSYPFTYTINAANTFEYKTVTIAGDTSGTWLTDNSTGLDLMLSIGMGSTFSGTAGAWAGATYYSAAGATNLISTNGATFYITGVQLEKGSTATSFDVRPYGTELALCQRYYTTFAVDQRYYPSSTSGNWSFTYAFKTSMRATPTTTQSGGLVNNMAGGGFNDITALDVNGMRIQSNPTSANTDTYALSRIITASIEL